MTGLAIVAVLAAAILPERATGSSRRPAAAEPAAKIEATIDLRLANELPVSGAIVGHDLWLGTNEGNLLRIDTRTNKLVGSPIALGAGHVPWTLLASGGKLYSADSKGSLLRIDPRTGRVTGQRHFAFFLTDMHVVDGVLWITSFDSSRFDWPGYLTRVDPRTLRTIGPVVGAPPAPLQLLVSGKTYWVVGGSADTSVVRAHAGSAERRRAHSGPRGERAMLSDGRIWIADPTDGTVSALDAKRMVFGPPTIVVDRSAKDVVALGSDLWVTASDGLELTGQVRLERFDAVTGRRAGAAIPLDGNTGFVLVGASSMIAATTLWAITNETVTRLTATSPRPALEQPASGQSPHALRPGPLTGGSWRATAFTTPFAFSVAPFTWRATVPSADLVELTATGERRAVVDVALPQLVYGDDDKPAQPVGDPAAVVAVIRKNPNLRVGPTRRVTIAGLPALQFELRSLHPEYTFAACSKRVCGLLFSLSGKDRSLEHAQGDVARVSLVRSHNRTVAIIEHGQGDDTQALAASAAIVKTLRFEH